MACGASSYNAGMDGEVSGWIYWAREAFLVFGVFMILVGAYALLWKGLAKLFDMAGIDGKGINAVLKVTRGKLITGGVIVGLLLLAEWVGWHETQTAMGVSATAMGMFAMAMLAWFGTAVFGTNIMLRKLWGRVKVGIGRINDRLWIAGALLLAVPVVYIAEESLPSGGAKGRDPFYSLGREEARCGRPAHLAERIMGYRKAGGMTKSEAKKYAKGWKDKCAK